MQGEREGERGNEEREREKEGKEDCFENFDLISCSVRVMIGTLYDLQRYFRVFLSALVRGKGERGEERGEREEEGRS